MTPTTIKGAYYVMGGNEQQTIGCVIYDPNREIVFKRHASPQGIIVFDTQGPGEYTIVFTNVRAKKPLAVTFAFHTYEEEKIVPVKYDIDSKTGQRFEIARDVTKEDAIVGALGGEENLAATEDEVSNLRKMLREI